MKPRFTWRHQYDDDRDKKEGEAAGLTCADDHLTVQSFMEDADLNVLAKRFGLNSIPLGPIDPTMFRDTTQDPELRDVLEHQRIAKEYFMALPAKMRTRFHNNMAELWDFVTNPENAEEAVRLGLLASTPSSAGADAPGKPGNATGSSTPSTTGQDPKGGQPPTPPDTTVSK